MNGNAETPAVVRTLQIIVFAMIAGMTGFAVIAAVLIRGGTFEPTLDRQALQTMLIVIGALVVGELPAYFVVRMAILSRLRQAGGEPPPEAGVAQAYQTVTLIGAAMIEGVALFATVVFLLSGQWLLLIVPGLGVLLLLILLPTHGKYQSFASSFRIH